MVELFLDKKELALLVLNILPTNQNSHLETAQPSTADGAQMAKLHQSFFPQKCPNLMVIRGINIGIAKDGRGANAITFVCNEQI